MGCVVHLEAPASELVFPTMIVNLFGVHTPLRNPVHPAAMDWIRQLCSKIDVAANVLNSQKVEHTPLLGNTVYCLLVWLAFHEKRRKVTNSRSVLP